jgi:hypothetical protein
MELLERRGFAGLMGEHVRTGRDGYFLDFMVLI